MRILAYNKRKAENDLSDKMASYVTLRKDIKWYRKLRIELLLGVVYIIIGNSKENLNPYIQG